MVANHLLTAGGRHCVAVPSGQGGSFHERHDPHEPPGAGTPLQEEQLALLAFLPASSRRSCSMQSTHQTGGDIVLACLFPSWFLEQIYKVASTVSSVYTGELGKGPGNGGQKEQGATAGPASGAGALVSSGSCDQRSGRGCAQPAPAISKMALIFR